MAAKSFFKIKYTCRVEFTTELPFDKAPRESPRFNMEGLEYYLKFTYENLYYKLCLMKVDRNSFSKRSIGVTTSIKDSFALEDKPVLIESKHCAISNDVTLWRKTGKEMSDQIPNILAIRKCTIVCLFHTKEPHFEETHIYKSTSLQQIIDFPSANRSPLLIDLKSLSGDFSAFLKDETFSDVRLICADRSFSAHRSILAARSEVFAAMFRNKMTECEDGKVDIKDVDPEVLEQLLEYVYSGKKPVFVESSAGRLYEAADKYAVHALKATCSFWLVENLTALNCLDILVLAEKHSDNHFLEAVTDFSAENLRLIKKKSWSIFKKLYPELAVKVYDKFFENAECSSCIRCGISLRKIRLMDKPHPS